MKSINLDSRSKKRLRFASSKERSAKASANVYHSYKDRIAGGVTSAATREHLVHNPGGDERAKKRQRKSRSSGPKDRNKTAVFDVSVKKSDDDGLMKDDNNEKSELEEIQNMQDDEEADMGGSTFASELDLAQERNASEIFGKFHRAIWIHTRSLPEILHNLDKVVTILLSFMLSPVALPETPTPVLNDDKSESNDKTVREEFIVNLATTDILHLIAVLARDLRHEIHPYLHTKILPRIITDLLNPPPPPPDSNKQPIPLDVTIVEASFRTMAYVFRYDFNLVVNEMESMRQYYGTTLGHRRELVRRLAAETFAPLIRRMKSQSARERHIRRVLKALNATSKLPSSHILMRTQNDAVNGLAQLMFQLVRGVSGALHSNGKRILRFLFEFLKNRETDDKKNGDGDGDDDNDDENDLSFEVVSGMMDKVCYHSRSSTFSTVSRELFSVFNAAVVEHEAVEAKNLRCCIAWTIIKYLRLVVKLATVRSGYLLEEHSETDFKALCDGVATICSGSSFALLPISLQSTTAKLLCQLWISLQSQECMEMQKHVSSILRRESKDENVVKSLTVIMARELLPQLQRDHDKTTVSSLLLNSAAESAQGNRNVVAEIVFAIVTSMSKSSVPSDNEDGFQLFYCMPCNADIVSSRQRNALLECVMQKESSVAENCSRISVALRCVPFIATLKDEDIESTYKKAAKWILDILDESVNEKCYLIAGMALEAFAVLSVAIAMRSKKGQLTAAKLSRRILETSERLLLSKHDSLWILRGAASLVPLVCDLSIGWDNVDGLFDVLVANLRRSDHFMRLYSIQILASFPQKNYVVDHADLDLRDDLDEDAGFQLSGSSNNDKIKQGPVGQCDLLKTLLDLELSPVSLNRERELITLVARVDVFVRTGRLPAIYAEAAMNHMLGVLHIKFSPLWSEAQKAIFRLMTTYEHVVWPAFETELVAVMRRSTPPPQPTATPLATTEDRGSFLEQHYRMCKNWETSQGKDVSLFGDYAEVKEGVIPRFHATDEVTVMESVWRAAELGHKIVVKHSRVVVPLFLSFLHNDFFPLQGKDQDARELHLEDVVANEHSTSDESQASIQHRQLKAFLRVFAAMDGPKQLVHHKVLEKAFRSFLAHQDVVVVELGLDCLVKFKLDYLTPYAQLVKKLLQKGKLRAALLEFSEMVESDKMDTEQRRNLIPIVSRVFFGRVSAKGGKSSSKDSPGARRTAVLSSLSVLCQEESDFFPMMYMMLRHFLPRSLSLDTIESMGQEKRKIVMETLMTSQTDEMSLSGPVVEGFLHLLESVISQLGHRVVSWVPQLTAVTIELCRHVAIKAENGNASPPETSNPNRIAQSLRQGPVRTLCLQRLSGLMSCYASRIDFTQFSEPLWAALDSSVNLLPSMVVGSRDSPALLVLLRTMSEQDSLIHLLSSNDKAVSAVIRCISATSMHSVMDLSLSFIENLLSDSENGQPLVRKHASQLMEQFAGRLEGSNMCESAPEAPRSSHPRRHATRSPTWRRELDILFQVSQFAKRSDDLVDDGAIFIERLCSLLVPFLETGQGSSDEDKLNVIGILSGIASQLEPSAAYGLFVDLSSTLGPHKSKEGLRNLQVRHGIACLMDELALMNPQLKKISSLLVRFTSLDTKRVDEMDFEAVIPALNFFTKQERGGSWVSLCASDACAANDLAALINTCFNYLFNLDGVISRASYNALKELVAAAASESERSEEWMRLMESVVVPLSRSGLLCRDTQVRRYCTLLVREISKAFQHDSSTFLCGDLWQFCNDENEDLDFFIGITHVQIHRRARAYQRLRKKLVTINDASTESTLSMQSLSNVLIPLTVHPIYECKTKSEEGLALESIATLGALSRMLSWSKYNNLLWTLISQFDRHPEQERYLVGAMCAMIDSFNFQLLSDDEDEDATKGDTRTSVWRSLENRIIPKMEGLLTKETSDRHGNRIKSLRPSIVLAMTKLFQKFPLYYFESKLPGVITVICDVLRSRDSDSRDMARTTLAKIVCSVDLKYLADVVRELALTLTEGFKLHVRAAAIHTILLELSKVYGTPSKAEATSSLCNWFDKCVPALMDLIQEDLFGEANERKTSQETNVRYVKEAGGNKSLHSIELVSKMITFSPTDSSDGKQSRSAVHCVLSPFLERLRSPDIDAAMIRKIKEILARVVTGVTHNSSVTGKELLPFIYATIHPFIGEEAINAVKTSEQSDVESETDDDASVESIKVSGRNGAGSKRKQVSGRRATSVVEWRPSSLKTSSSEKTATGLKYNQRRTLHKVQDGSSAPKLTGSSRHRTLESSSGKKANDPSTISGIVFCLNLMSSCLKKTDIIKDATLMPMMDPFVPMLTACVTHCRSTEVSLVALKCLHHFLRVDLPSTPKCSRTLGSQTLHLLSTTGSSSNQNHDLTQACFKTLTYIISNDKESDQKSNETSASQTRSENGEQIFINRASLPLNSEQMKVLISLLQVSITQTEQHNPALNLIRAILSQRFVSPEFYDLMESLLKLVVRSQKPTLRQQSATLFVRYLLDYPMSEERFEQHLKQVVANISYEFQEGRLSGGALLILVIEKLPQELLEKHAQLLFLPLVMQLLNDDSKDCRAKVSQCIVMLLSRSSTDLAKTFLEYCARWSKQAGPLRLASLQVFGLLTETRTDILRTNTFIQEWAGRLQDNLEERQHADWEVTYFTLVCLEKLSHSFSDALSKRTELWSHIIDCLVDDHPWVMMASSRIVRELFVSGVTTQVLAKKPGLLFHIARNLCVQLNASEENQNEDLTDMATKTLTLLLPLMKEHPEFCYSNDVEDDDEPASEGGRDPVFWLIRRLSQMAKNKGSKRRLAVYKCFAAFGSSNFSIVAPYLELMLESLHRTIVEGKNEIDNHALSQKQKSTSIFVQQLQQQQQHQQREDQPVDSVNGEYSMAEEVLRLLEEQCESTDDDFLNAYSNVKRRARDKKEKRKSEEKSLAVLDPKAFAEQKIQKQVRNKERRKRRAHEQRRNRGGLDKRRRSS